MSCHFEPREKDDTKSVVSWFMSRFLVMVSWVPGLAETMTKGDMARVMVCRSYTRVYARASMGVPTGPRKGRADVMVSALSAKGGQAPIRLTAGACHPLLLRGAVSC